MKTRHWRYPASVTALAVILGGLSQSAAAQAVGGMKLPAPVTGEEVYRQACQSCHMPGGVGGEGGANYPALAKNPRLAGAAYPITMVVRGKSAMPWFEGTLSAAQIAAVVGYIRTNFGNAYTAPVTEAEVKALMKPSPGGAEAPRSPRTE